MSRERYAAVIGWGMAVPSRVITNDDLAQRIDTSDEWIRTRTGIRERRVASPGESTSTFATAAGREALAMAGVDATTIDTVIVATCTLIDRSRNRLHGASKSEHPTGDRV